MTSQSTQGIDRTEPTTPDPDDPRKPDAPTDLKKRTWWYVARKVWREFSTDQCTDLAAALTYYAVLALFPAALALTSGSSGWDSNRGKRSSTTRWLKMVEDLGWLLRYRRHDPSRGSRAARPASQTAGLAFVLGARRRPVVGGSAYVGAFGRAMNRIYEIDEGRPIWKLRPDH